MSKLSILRTTSMGVAIASTRTAIELKPRVRKAESAHVQNLYPTLTFDEVDRIMLLKLSLAVRMHILAGQLWMTRMAAAQTAASSQPE